MQILWIRQNKKIKKIVSFNILGKTLIRFLAESWMRRLTPLCSCVTMPTQRRATQRLSISLADPVCHQIPCNTRSREVAFRIKIKCSRQFSVFSLRCKLWRITSLSDIITYSGTILDLTSVLHSYCTALDATSVWD